MKRNDLVGKTFKVGNINGDYDCFNVLEEKRWGEVHSKQLEGTITINRITKKNTAFFTLDITQPYQKHFDEMRGKMHGVHNDENGEWGKYCRPSIVRHFNVWGNVEWMGRFRLWRNFLEEPKEPLAVNNTDAIEQMAERPNVETTNNIAST